ncbi:MAG: SPFH domain-containing protein [Pirellulaceae bacterium]
MDLRETAVDVSGQEIMTADKVSLRMNAIVTYRIANARKVVSAADVRQT